MRIYTRTGDGGTTALLGGSRVAKDDPFIEANGALDEAQAFLGLARAACEKASPLDELLVQIEKDLWIVMGEIALGTEASAALRRSTPVATQAMVDDLEARIDHEAASLDLERLFAVPGDNGRAASLDVARTVVRRAERLVAGLALADSLALAYLNRLSDLCWVLARAAEVEHRTHRRRGASAGEATTSAPTA